MTLSAVALASRALLKIGAESISGFDEASTEAEVAAALYGPTRDALVSAYPWSFATAQSRLARLDATPLADYRHAFQVPDGFLRALSAGTGPQGRGLRYRITGRHLHADRDPVILTYIFRPAEGDVPPFFDQALIARLAAEMVIPLTESTSRAEALFRLAEEEFRRARTIDARQDTPPRVEDVTLIRARGGR